MKQNTKQQQPQKKISQFFTPRSQGVPSRRQDEFEDVYDMQVCRNTPTQSLKRKVTDLKLGTDDDEHPATPQLLSTKKPKTMAVTTNEEDEDNAELDNMLNPPTAAAEQLRSFVEQSAGDGSVFIGDAVSFESRVEEELTFLKPDVRMDVMKRKPTHPDYDPRTCFIPESFYKENKISEGQRQWWEFKKMNMDSVMLFKVGKFYELFEMDAEVGVEVLNLIQMKGPKLHAGFPEVSYHKMAEQLVMAGYKVIVVEQVETPEQLAERNQQNKIHKKKQEKVVRREVVSVLSKGILMDAEMVSCRPDATYVVGIFEDEGRNLGVCAVDVASCHIMLGQFTDDNLFATLRCHLTSLKPVELIYPNGGLVSEIVKKAVRKHMMDDSVRINTISGEFWCADDAHNKISRYFEDFEKLPEVLQELVRRGLGLCRCSWSVLGGVLQFLRESLLDQVLLPVARIDKLPVYGVVGGCCTSKVMQDVVVSDEVVDEQQVQYMALEGATLQNLEVLENSEGGVAGSLLSSVDYCCTPFGRRLLRSLLCKPLVDISKIEERQDAVSDLLDSCIDASSEAINYLSKVSDVERAIARLVAQGKSGGGFGREARHVNLYEDVGKRRIKSLFTALTDLRGLLDAVKAFQSVLPRVRSPLLKRLLTIGHGFPDIQHELDGLWGMADWEKAIKCGQIVPGPGQDAEYDDACQQVLKVEQQLDDYLREVQLLFKDRSKIQYVSWTKNSHLMEVADKSDKYVPGEWELVHRRKGYRRYQSQQSKLLSTLLKKAKESRDKVLANILQKVVEAFSIRKDLWFEAVQACGWLDFLMSLARAAVQGEGEMCRPKLIHAVKPLFNAKKLRHPAKIKIATGEFIENDVVLGGEQDPAVVVITGPNMGGKSTLLRQVCLCTLIAQVGGWVSASECVLTPTDMMFARMGARDDILRGQSTFYVESHETAVMLNKATSKTILALDEFGRGTATLDGTALASAVLNHIIDNIGCRTMFATHYQKLATAYGVHPGVSTKYMDFRFVDDRREDIVFLYKLVEGVCTQSFGPNVAKLAGLPESIITRAKQIAKESNAHLGGHTNPDFLLEQELLQLTTI